ncbi:MAG: SPFH domain-containing protein [Cytophagales bacterium]|nr:SPFH domain-containing protein [Armatimonadota bacterium]
MKVMLRAFLIAPLLVFAAAALSGCSGFVVKTGNVGLVVNHYTGNIDGRVRHAGFNAQPPFSGSELIEIPTYQRTYTMVQDSAEGTHTGDDSVLVNTASSNNLHADVSVTYHIVYDPARGAEIVRLYNKYRTQFQGSGFGAFEETQLRPLFRNAVSNAFGKASTLEAMTGQGKQRAAEDARNALNLQLAPDAIRVDEVRIRAVYPDESTKKTLRTHLEAEQNLRLATLNQKLSDLSSQKEVSRVTAEAQAARLRAASLTPRLVKFRHLDKLNIIGVARGSVVSIPPTAAATTSTSGVPGNSGDPAR